MRTIVVDVTQEDIDKGEPGMPYGCAMARALQRAFDCPTASIGFTTIGVGKRPALQVTGAMARFVQRFDNGKPVQPTRFRLRVPE